MSILAKFHDHPNVFSSALAQRILEWPPPLALLPTAQPAKAHLSRFPEECCK
jgi:hypothetical protein